MRFFFRSRKFKIIAGITGILLVFVIVMQILGSIASPTTSILGAVVSPIQKFSTWLTTSISDFNTTINDGQALMQENEELRAENERLTNEVLDYQEIKEENAFYEEFLEIKEQNSDFVMEPATLIAMDSTDPYLGFTIDKGLLNGIAAGDPVITSAGLVGYISETAPSYSKVTTILSADLNIGSVDKRTKDAGIVSGKLSLAEKGLCRLYNLPRTCSVAVGDYVVTSGGGVFPSGLLIGTVTDIKAEEINTSVYAILDPVVDIPEIRDVMVLTYFSGQGETLPSE
ncbi:MAG: rod shape-determining protein MreC [Oscillospiraceae bacterium]|nr:rod shape-determining protein MreC [Oscillospiraceae bacterium]